MWPKISAGDWRWRRRRRRLGKQYTVDDHQPDNYDCERDQSCFHGWPLHRYLNTENEDGNHNAMIVVGDYGAIRLKINGWLFFFSICMSSAVSMVSRSSWNVLFRVDLKSFEDKDMSGLWLLPGWWIDGLIGLERSATRNPSRLLCVQSYFVVTSHRIKKGSMIINTFFSFFITGMDNIHKDLFYKRDGKYNSNTGKGGQTELFVVFSVLMD